MAITPINVGIIANDGTGDDLREAFVKVNNNIDDLDTRFQTLTSTTGTNVGSGGFGIFKEKVASDFQFRTLAIDPLSPGTITLRVSNDNNSLYVASTQASWRITDGTNSIVTSVENFLTVSGTSGATVSVNNGTRTLTVDSSIINETAPTLNATLDANNNRINNVSHLNGITAAELAGIFAFDFGSTGNDRTSIIDWIANSQDMEFGTFLSPATQDADLGGLS